MRRGLPLTFAALGLITTACSLERPDETSSHANSRLTSPPSPRITMKVIGVDGAVAFQHAVALDVLQPAR